LIKLYKGLQIVNRLFALGAGVIVAILTVVILYDVTARYIICKPLAWSIDFGELALLPIVYLPAALLSQEGGHVNVELLVRHFSGKVRAVVDIFTSLLGLFFAALLGWQSIVIFFDVFERGTLTMIGNLPVYPAVGFFIIGALLFTLQQLINLLKSIPRINEH